MSTTSFAPDPATQLQPQRTEKQRKAEQKEELAEQYAKLRAGKMQGRDWVEDELVYRDERDALAQIPMHGIKAEPTDDKWWRGVRAGPGWQLRPSHTSDGSTTGRIARGRKAIAMQAAIANGKIIERPVIFLVVGAVVAQGNNKTVRVEGAVDLSNTQIDPDLVRSRRMGLWQDAIIERSGRHYVRAVVWLCQRELAAGQAYNQLLNTGWEGKKLMLICAPSSGGWPWFKGVGIITPVDNEIAGYCEVGRAIGLKTKRAIVQREEFFGRLRSRLESLVWAGADCNRRIDDVQALQKVLIAMSPDDLCKAVRQITPLTFDQGKTDRAKQLASKRFYGAKLVALFKLNREIAMSKSSLASVIGFAPIQATPPTQCEPATSAEATEAAEATSDDIEAKTPE